MLILCLRSLIIAGVLLIAGESVGSPQELPAPEGWAALEKGDASKASAIFRDALDRSPDNALLHYGIANASLGLGRTDAAISSLKKAIERNPRFVEAMVLLARVAYGSADLDLAVKSLEKAVAILPRDRQLAEQLATWKKESELHQSFQTRPGARFNVLFEGPAERAISDRVSAVLESAYGTVGKELDTYPGLALEVILYSNQQFQDITRAPAWAGGGFDGRIRLPVGNALRSPQTLDRVVIHEYVHSVVRTAAPTGVPGWINEGLASHLEPGDKTWAARALRTSPDRIRLEDMVNGFGHLDGRLALIAYAESEIAAGLLMERLRPQVGPFLQLLGNGYTVDQALSRHGVEPATFYAEWRRRVGISDQAR